MGKQSKLFCKTMIDIFKHHKHPNIETLVNPNIQNHDEYKNKNEHSNKEQQSAENMNVHQFVDLICSELSLLDVTDYNKDSLLSTLSNEQYDGTKFALTISEYQHQKKFKKLMKIHFIQTQKMKKLKNLMSRVNDWMK